MFRKLFLLAVIGVLFFSSNPINVQSQANDGIQLDVPFYSQRDETWSTKKLGKSNLTIGTDGCGITSAAMILEYYDINFDPGTINTEFKDNGGFSGPLMIWGQNNAWQKATNNQIKGVSRYPYYDEKVLLDNLDHGRPVVVFLSGRHYVVVTGYETISDSDNPDKTKKQFYINDPWAVDYFEGENIKIEDNLLKVTTKIVQMNVLHTDPVLPVTGPLVDWPAIQEKYLAVGGVEGRLGKPLGDDTESYFNDSRGQVQIRSQLFENGKIFAYKTQGQNVWKSAWIPKEFSDVYTDYKYGLLLGDAYTNITIGGAFIERIDAEQASFIYQPWDEKVIIITKDNGIYAEYFSNQDLQGSPVLTRYEKDLNFSWQAGPTHPDLPDKYSARFTLPVQVNVPWSRTFVVSASGGVRSYLDGDLLFDKWNSENPGHIELTRWIGRGGHEWIIEYHNTSDTPAFLAGYTEWPVKIAYADESYGAFEGKPESAPPLDVEIPIEVTPPPFASLVIDDLDTQFSIVDSVNAWDESSAGYDQHSYFSNDASINSGKALWEITDLSEGEYELFVYIPVNVSVNNSAEYTIIIDQEETVISINQEENQNIWSSLGKYSLMDGTDVIVQLKPTTDLVAADAIAYLQIDTSSWGGEISEQLQEWWDEQLENIEKAFKEWWGTQKDKIEQAVKDWWDDLQRRIIEWLENELEDQLNRICFGGFIPLFAAAMIRVHNRVKGKIERNVK